MVTIKENRLIIDIEHPCPKRFIFDLKHAIIDAIQAEDPQTEHKDELQEANNTLLELLRSII